MVQGASKKNSDYYRKRYTDINTLQLFFELICCLAQARDDGLTQKKTEN